jgi:hypothetical protein
MYASCVCCMLQGRSVCEELITRQEEPYRLWCVCVIVEPHRGGLNSLGLSRHEKNYIFIKSTEWQAVEGRNQTTQTCILLMLWRIMQWGEEFCT